MTDVEQKIADLLTAGGSDIIRVALTYKPVALEGYGRGGGEQLIREWIRDSRSDLFEESKIPALASSMIAAALEAADGMPAGKHRFVIRRHVYNMMAGGEFAFQLTGGSGFSDEEMVAIDMILTDLDQHGRITRRRELCALVTSSERRDDVTMFIAAEKDWQMPVGFSLHEDRAWDDRDCAPTNRVWPISEAGWLAHAIVHHDEEQASQNHVVAKIKISLEDPEIREVWKSALAARREVATWPAWKRGEDVASAAISSSGVTPELREKLLQLLSDCPLGHHNGRLLQLRSETDAGIIAWIDRLYEVKDELRAMTARDPDDEEQAP